MSVLEGVKIYPPPWLAYPGYDIDSKVWNKSCRYLEKFKGWYGRLTEDEKLEYKRLFPEPISWKGYYEGKEECMKIKNGEFSIPVWNQNGLPKYNVQKIMSENPNKDAMDIVMFFGHTSKDCKLTKACFSQWYNKSFTNNEYRYCCMEQFMMSKKAEIFGDYQTLYEIMESDDPKTIKRYGREVKGFDEKIWNKAKYWIVVNGNYHKFIQNKDLRDFLFSTGDKVMAEASPYDGIWGIKLPESLIDSRYPEKWQGENLLGFALMEVRDELRRICKNEHLCDMSVI